MNTKELSLRQALEASCCRELPRQLQPDEDRMWVNAIILVKKRNLTEAYCLAKRRGNGSFEYTHDFGAMSPIVGVVAIYPYLYLDKRFLYEKKSEKEKKALLCKNYPKDIERIKNATEEELQVMMFDYALTQQRDSAKSLSIMEEIEQGLHNCKEDLTVRDIPAANKKKRTYLD